MAEPKKMPSGNWRVRVFLGKDKDGKKKYKSITAATKKEAKKAADRFELSLTSACVDYNDLTLEQAYEMYIDSKSAVLSPSTIAGYEKIKRNYFTELMPFKLTKLTAVLIQNSVNALSVNHSPKTVRNAHGLLSAVLKTYCPTLTLNTTLPQKIKPQYTIPTTEDINKLLELADDRLRVPIKLASQGSLRRSEICALQLSDFNSFGVSITKAVVADNNGKFIVKTTKTEAGTRFVPLPSSLIQECKEWQHFGISPSTLSSAFNRLVEKADVAHFSFHKLRHYFASECHAQGIPDQYIAEIGGWQTVDMLHKIYQHTLRDKTDTIATKIVTMFSANFADDPKDDAKRKKA